MKLSEVGDETILNAFGVLIAIDASADLSTGSRMLPNGSILSVIWSQEPTEPTELPQAIGRT